MGAASGNRVGASNGRPPALSNGGSRGGPNVRGAANGNVNGIRPNRLGSSNRAAAQEENDSDALLVNQYMSDYKKAAYGQNKAKSQMRSDSASRKA